MKKYFLAGFSAFVLANTNAQTGKTVTPASTTAQEIAQSFKEFAQSVNAYSAGSEGNTLLAFKVSEGTEGSPYLLSNWTPGKVFLTTGAVYPESTPVLNFDKIKQVLVLKLTPTTVFEVDMKTVKSFELNDSGNLYKFVSLETKPGEKVLEVYRDSSYALYKAVSTEFFRADYVNKGIGESGYKYDRYVDKITWYIKGRKGQLVKIETVIKRKLKQLEDVLPGINDAIKNTTGSIENNEAYLIALLSAMPRS